MCWVYNNDIIINSLELMCYKCIINISYVNISYIIEALIYDIYIYNVLLKYLYIIYI